MNLFISLIFIVLLLSIHGYLNYYYVNDNLTYVHGFLLFVKLEWLLVFTNLIFHLGWIYGIIISIALLFGGNYLLIPITTLLHTIDGSNSKNQLTNMLAFQAGPNMILYGLWSTSIVVFGQVLKVL